MHCGWLTLGRFSLCKHVLHHQVLLSRYGRAEDVVTGTPLANRSRQELEGLYGYFVTSVALRTDLSGMLRHLRQTCMVLL